MIINLDKGWKIETEADGRIVEISNSEMASSSIPWKPKSLRVTCFKTKKWTKNDDGSFDAHEERFDLVEFIEMQNRGTAPARAQVVVVDASGSEGHWSPRGAAPPMVLTAFA